jgi:hypothetical protein
MYASLEAIVEFTLASTTSKDLSFYYKLVLTFGTSKSKSRQEGLNLLKDFATSYASCGDFAGILFGVGIPYCGM